MTQPRSSLCYHLHGFSGASHFVQDANLPERVLSRGFGHRRRYVACALSAALVFGPALISDSSYHR